MIYMLQPSMANTSWRTLWPGLELRRRGHQVVVDARDAGYGPEEPPRGALTVVHLTPSLWSHEPWRRRMETAMERAGRVVVSLDDDWTHLL